MRVLFTVNIPSPYRVDFFNELGKSCDLTVIFEAQDAKDRDKSWKADKAENFKAVFLKGKRIGAAESIAPGVIKYLSPQKYDIIVIGLYSSPTGMLAIEYMRMHKIPFILNSDGGMIKNDSAFTRIVKQHFIGAASAWLSTGATTSEYFAHYGADPNRIYIYPFTSVREADVLEHPLTDAEKQPYRKQLAMTEEKIVLSVGQFIHRKGYDILLKACKSLGDSVGVYIVGGSPTEEYSSLKDQLGLEHVHFVEFMPKAKLADYYKAADLFVLPTREDIWGLVVNEAMAYGLPVITTDRCVAGIEMVRDGMNGYIVPAENVDSLAQAICRALEQDMQGSLAVAREYTIEKMALAHRNIFHNCSDLR